MHAPDQVPDSYKAPYLKLPNPRQTFAGMLSCLDEGVGNVSRALEAKGMTNETVVVVTADNGSPTPSCGGYQGGQNYPLRGTCRMTG